jgi:hypothetical protein
MHRSYVLSKALPFVNFHNRWHRHVTFSPRFYRTDWVLRPERRLLDRIKEGCNHECSLSCHRRCFTDSLPFRVISDSSRSTPPHINLEKTPKPRVLPKHVVAAASILTHLDRVWCVGTACYPRYPTKVIANLKQERNCTFPLPFAPTSSTPLLTSPRLTCKFSRD